MNRQTQTTGQKTRSTSRIILGGLTIVLLAFFTIPSIPSWWAVLHLSGLKENIQHTEKKLAEVQDSIEKLEAKKLMSPSDPGSQDSLEFQIRPLKKDEAFISARLDHDTKRYQQANDKIAEAHNEWWKIVLEFGGLVGALLHSIDALKRIWSWLFVLKGAA